MNDSYQFPLCMLCLKMESPQHAFHRETMIILDKSRIYPELLELSGLISLCESTSGVSEDFGFDDGESWNSGLFGCEGHGTL